MGLSFSIHQFKDLYSLKVGGYNDKLPVYLLQILSILLVYAKEGPFWVDKV